MVKFDNETKYIDGWLKKNLDLLIEFNKQDWDTVLYLCGQVGAGKTTLANQLAYYCDRNYNPEQVAFTPEEFANRVESAKPHSAIVYDEAYVGFSNRFFQDRASKLLVSMLNMVRKKNLFLFIVSPGFWDVQKYLIVDRSRVMLYVYAKGMRRGFFSFYNRKKKAELYYKGKIKHAMNVVKPNFIGRFTKWVPFPQEKYEALKDEAIKNLVKQFNKKTDKRESEARA